METCIGEVKKKNKSLPKGKMCNLMLKQALKKWETQSKLKKEKGKGKGNINI